MLHMLWLVLLVILHIMLKLLLCRTFHKLNLIQSYITYREYYTLRVLRIMLHFKFHIIIFSKYHLAHLIIEMLRFMLHMLQMILLTLLVFWLHSEYQHMVGYNYRWKRRVEPWYKFHNHCNILACGIHSSTMVQL